MCCVKQVTSCLLVLLHERLVLLVQGCSNSIVITVFGFDLKSSRSLVKRQLTDDRFTRRGEAVARSLDLGLGGDVHAHESADGEAVWMPGESHDVYLAHSGVDVASYSGNQKQESTISDIIAAIFDRALTYASGDRDRPKFSLSGVTKADEEQRMVYGWGSVITYRGETFLDSQGDMISPDELVRTTTEFMISDRDSKVLHQGGVVGMVVHSMPLTYELAEALGIETETEGWIVGVKVYADWAWDAIKRGELKMFSIGGSGERVAA